MISASIPYRNPRRQVVLPIFCFNSQGLRDVLQHDLMHSRIWKITFMEMQTKVLCTSVIQSHQNHSRPPRCGSTCPVRVCSSPQAKAAPARVLCKSPALRCPSCPCSRLQDVSAARMWLLPSSGRARLASTPQSLPTGGSCFLMYLEPGKRLRAPEHPSPGHQTTRPSCMAIAKAAVVQRGHQTQPQKVS